MVSVPDPQRSRAVLIGAASYRNMEPVPAVKENLRQLKRVLCDPDIWGLPAENCVVVSDPASTDDIFDPLHSAAAQAEDALVIYYAGHGLRNHDKHTLLVTHIGSDSNRSWTTIEYHDVLRVIKDTRASRRIIVLDCCYSGLAGALGDVRTEFANLLPSEFDTDGTYQLAATPKNVEALAPPGDRLTAFTAELLNVLEHGIRGRGPLLEMQTIWIQLVNVMRARHLPEPYPEASRNAMAITLVRNRAYNEDEVDSASMPAVSAGPVPYPAAAAGQTPRSAVTSKSATHVLTLKPSADSPDQKPAPLRAVAFDPAGELVAAAGKQGRVLIWHCATGQLVNAARVAGSVNALCFRDSDQVFCAGAYRNIDEVWRSGHWSKDARSLAKVEYDVTTMAFTRGYRPRIVTAGDVGVIQTWGLQHSMAYYVDGSDDRLNTPGLARSWSSQDSHLYSVAVAGENAALVASAGSSGIARLWNIDDGELRQSLEGGTGPLRAVAISDDESVVAAGGDAGVIRLWDVQTGSLVCTLQDRRAPVRALAIDTRGDLLAVATDDATVTLWDLDSYEIVSTGRGHEGSVLALALSSEGLLASASADGTVRLWRMPVSDKPLFTTLGNLGPDPKKTLRQRLRRK